MSTVVRDDLVLSHAVVTADVETSFDDVDIAQWLKTLPTHEYQRCAPGSQGGWLHGRRRRDADVDQRRDDRHGTGGPAVPLRRRRTHYCKMVSLSDILTPAGWTTTQVIWELRMEQLDGDRCRYTNTVTSHPTEDFLKFIAEQGQTFDEAAHARQDASGRHCQVETPLYAQSIPRRCTIVANVPADRRGTTVTSAILFDILARLTFYIGAQ